jgi:hypothetical protein
MQQGKYYSIDFIDGVYQKRLHGGNGMEQTISRFEIIETSDGYMINYMTDDGDMQSLHAPDGDNTFDNYSSAVVVLTQHLLRGII